MVVCHLLTGMILQVPDVGGIWCFGVWEFSLDLLDVVLMNISSVFMHSKKIKSLWDVFVGATYMILFIFPAFLQLLLLTCFAWQGQLAQQFVGLGCWSCSIGWWWLYTRTCGETCWTNFVPTNFTSCRGWGAEGVLVCFGSVSWKFWLSLACTWANLFKIQNNQHV